MALAPPDGAAVVAPAAETGAAAYAAADAGEAAGDASARGSGRARAATVVDGKVPNPRHLLCQVAPTRPRPAAGSATEGQAGVALAAPDNCSSTAGGQDPSSTHSSSSSPDSSCRGGGMVGHGVAYTSDHVSKPGVKWLTMSGAAAVPPPPVHDLAHLALTPPSWPLYELCSPQPAGAPQLAMGDAACLPVAATRQQQSLPHPARTLCPSHTPAARPPATRSATTPSTCTAFSCLAGGKEDVISRHPSPNLPRV